MGKSPQVPGSMLAVAVCCLLLPPAITWMLERQRAARAPAGPAFPSAELRALDRVVQARFAVVPDRDFGMSRIAQRHPSFRPTSASEEAAVAAVEARGKKVMLFVAGRSFLLGNPSPGFAPPTLQGPIFMTPNLRPQIAKAGVRPGQAEVLTPAHLRARRLLPGLPSLAALGVQVRGEAAPMLESASAWDHTATPPVKRFRVGAWDAVAVPVRANSTACLGCHQRTSVGDAPRLGDPLAIAVYLFQQG